MVNYYILLQYLQHNFWVQFGAGQVGVMESDQINRHNYFKYLNLSLILSQPLS